MSNKPLRPEDNETNVQSEDEFATTSPFEIKGAKYVSFEHSFPLLSETLKTPSGEVQGVSATVKYKGWAYDAQTSPNQYYIIMLSGIEISNGSLISNNTNKSIGFALDEFYFDLMPAYLDGSLEAWREGAKMFSAVPATTSIDQLDLSVSIPMTLKVIENGSPVISNKLLNLSAANIPGGQASFDLTDWHVTNIPSGSTVPAIDWRYDQSIPWNPQSSPARDYPNGTYPNQERNQDGYLVVEEPGLLATTSFRTGGISAYTFDASYIEPPTEREIYWMYNYSAEYTLWTTNEKPTTAFIQSQSKLTSPAINLYALLNQNK